MGENPQKPAPAGKPKLRDAKGRLQKGAGSLNPGGRPKEWTEVREACRKLEPQTIAVLVDLMHNSRVDMVRFMAASRLRDEAWGKPTQRTEISGPDGKPLQVEQRSWLDAVRAELGSSSSSTLKVEA